MEAFQPGDLLLARDEHDSAGPLQLKQVEEVFTRTAPVIELVVRGRGMGTTVEHPFYVVERDDFIPAGQIDIGETFQSHDGQLVRLEAIRDTGRVTTVYNFRIADFHTYFVGGKEWGFSVWVHNQYTTIHHATSRSRAGKIMGLGTYGQRQQPGFRAGYDGLVYFAEESDLAIAFAMAHPYTMTQTKPLRYSLISLTMEDDLLKRLANRSKITNGLRDYDDPIYDSMGNWAYGRHKGVRSIYWEKITPVAS